MKRPSEKLLKDMASAELSAESEWHAQRAALLLDEVNQMREDALNLGEQASEEILQAATQMEAEAEAHTHQSNLLTTLRSARLSDTGVGEVFHAAKV